MQNKKKDNKKFPRDNFSLKMPKSTVKSLNPAIKKNSNSNKEKKQQETERNKDRETT